MFVYAMRGGGYAKIGVSDDIEKRLSSFNRGALPFEMSIICLAEINTIKALEIEADILSKMPVVRGEWIEGTISDADLIAAFQGWPWTGPILLSPSLDEVAKANRTSAMNRQLEASRAVAKATENKMPANVDWLRIATELSERGEIGALRKLKKTFQSKRLAAQHRASR